jgi:para-nitrobenzyl esterase
VAAAEQLGAELTDCLGVSTTAELRGLSTAKILFTHLARTPGPWESRNRYSSVSLSVFDTANPIVDGQFLPESPLMALLSGNAADAPLLAGNAVHEGTGLPHLASLTAYRGFVEETFREHAQEALRSYPANTNAKPKW